MFKIFILLINWGILYKYHIDKPLNIIMKCALIGTSKIAEVHLVELIKIGAKELTFISRNLSRGKDLCKI